MTYESEEAAPKRPRGPAPQAGAARQRAYRQRKKLRFLEVTEETHGRLKTICEQKAWSIDQTVAQALASLEAVLKSEVSSAALTEMHKCAGDVRVVRDIPRSAKSPDLPRKRKLPPVLEEIEGQGSLL